MGVYVCMYISHIPACDKSIHHNVNVAVCESRQLQQQQLSHADSH